jgi:hypothetical protein
VIHLSRWWNPAVEEQCNDRVHRIGQTRPVSIHAPMAVHPGYRENSFDCLLHSLMNRKRKLAKSALWPMGDTEGDVAELQKMLNADNRNTLAILCSQPLPPHFAAILSRFRQSIKTERLNTTREAAIAGRNAASREFEAASPKKNDQRIAWSNKLSFCGRVRNELQDFPQTGLSNRSTRRIGADAGFVLGGDCATKPAATCPTVWSLSPLFSQAAQFRDQPDRTRTGHKFRVNV